MKWSTYKVIVQLISNGQESQIKVQAVSKADAKWRAINKILNSNYEAILAEKVE